MTSEPLRHWVSPSWLQKSWGENMAWSFVFHCLPCQMITYKVFCGQLSFLWIVTFLRAHSATLLCPLLYSQWLRHPLFSWDFLHRAALSWITDKPLSFKHKSRRLCLHANTFLGLPSQRSRVGGEKWGRGKEKANTRWWITELPITS